MFTRLFLGVVLGAAVATQAFADGDPDRPMVTGPLHSAANTDSVWMDLGYPVKTESSRRASRIDVERLKRLNTKPSVKCAKIEYVYQCLSSQPMHLTRVRCRAGSTEASCCKGVRDHVNSKICGPLWDRLKKAGKTYFPGIWLCKCIEQPRRLRLKKRRPIRPR